MSFANSAVSVKTTGTVSNALTTVPGGLTVTYTSSNTDVAAVADDGQVTLTGTAGSATITASFAGDEKYQTASTSYMLTVANDQISYTVKNYTGIYDGKFHGVTISVANPTGAKVTYGEGGNSFADAGTYAVNYTIKAKGYDEVTGTATVVISKADLTDKV